MKTIIIPIDFSENADIALNYAAEFAKKQNALLIVLHCYSVNYPNAETPYSIIEEIKSDAHKKALFELNNAWLKLAGANAIEHSLIALEGDPKHVILDLAKEKNADLIIMGTKGAGSVLNQIFGSTAAKIIEKAACPVITVPSGTIVRLPQKITYATDYHDSDFLNLKSLVELAKLFSAQVNILHIANEGHSPQDDKTVLENFMKKVNSRIDYNNLSFQILTGENIEEVLERYLEDNATDLLVMSAHHRDFIDKILGKSVTKQMAYHSIVPLMAFHYNKESSLKLV